MYAVLRRIFVRNGRLSYMRQDSYKAEIRQSLSLALHLSSARHTPRSRLWYSTAFGGVVCILGYSLTNQARCLDDNYTGEPLILYQYATCPYCCKTRAFLDYYRIPYSVVEVHPLFKREIKFSEYRKVPFVIGGGVQVNDSSLIVSAVRTAMLNREVTLSQALDFYPEMIYMDAKGKTHQERANKYFVMFPDGGTGHLSLAQRREERDWREWVDNTLVHTLPPNIYRSFSEALTSFNYISSAGNFNMFERLTAKYVGAMSMFIISKFLKRRYKLKDDVRESLYDCCNEWTRALAGRRFMGGDSPNLADLAVYGVLSSLEGMGDTFSDIMTHTRIGSWYRDIKEAVRKGEGSAEQRMERSML